MDWITRTAIARNAEATLSASNPVRVPAACVEAVDAAKLTESSYGIATACIAAFLAAPGTGKWKVKRDHLAWYVDAPKEYVYGPFRTEAMATSVCAALNATTPEEEA